MCSSDLKEMLRGLSSLIEDGNDENDEGEGDDDSEEDEENREPFLNKPVNRFAHASFRDYLFNSRRSGRFHVDLQEYENQLTIRSFTLIMQLIRSWR